MVTQTFPLCLFLLQIVAHVSTSYNRYDKCSSSARPCVGATWDSNGKTVAGGNGEGNALNQLNSSYGVFVDSNDALFISDYNNNRVIKYESGASTGILYAGGQCGVIEQGQLCSTSVITFDKEGTMFITAQDDRNGSVIRWKKGATSGETIIIANTSFYGIAMDPKETFLYVGHHREHRVVKYTKDGLFVSIVAGGNGPGAALNQLHYLRGVAVDTNGSVYVSDSSNHRIVKWMVNATEGILVAGGNGNGSRLDQLSTPGGLILDEIGTIYVADEDNNRIVSFPARARNGTVIAGGHGQGSASNQFNRPMSLAFNREGDLYVSDWNNFRVQKFAMDKNPPSGSDHICTPSNKYILIFCFLSLMISVPSFL